MHRNLRSSTERTGTDIPDSDGNDNGGRYPYTQGRASYRATKSPSIDTVHRFDHEGSTNESDVMDHDSVKTNMDTEQNAVLATERGLESEQQEAAPIIEVSVDSDYDGTSSQAEATTGRSDGTRRLTRNRLVDGPANNNSSRVTGSSSLNRLIRHCERDTLCNSQTRWSNVESGNMMRLFIQGCLLICLVIATFLSLHTISTSWSKGPEIVALLIIFLALILYWRPVRYV